MSGSIEKLTAQLSAGAENLKRAVEGLSPGDLRKAPPPDAGPEIGKWSIQQVVLHLGDAEASFADRIKRLIAEDEPTLLEWNENRFAERLLYDEQSADDAVAIIDLTRRQLMKVLKNLPDTVLERAGTHSSRGRQTLGVVIGFDIWHLQHHLKFIEAKRRLFSPT